MIEVNFYLDIIMYLNTTANLNIAIYFKIIEYLIIA